MTRPIVIPPEFRDDRQVQLLLMSWKNLHARHRICQKRIFWKLPSAGKLEKKRRREKWVIVARVLEIEFTLLRWCAKRTKHPDLWTSPDPDKPESRHARLMRTYHVTRRTLHNLTASQRTRREEANTARAKAVAKIRAIEREWMVALFTAVYPDLAVPKPIVLHPTELRPRKIKRAIRQLVQEVA